MIRTMGWRDEVGGMVAGFRAGWDEKHWSVGPVGVRRG